MPHLFNNGTFIYLTAKVCLMPHLFNNGTFPSLVPPYVPVSSVYSAGFWCQPAVLQPKLLVCKYDRARIQRPLAAAEETAKRRSRGFPQEHEEIVSHESLTPRSRTLAVSWRPGVSLINGVFLSSTLLLVNLGHSESMFRWFSMRLSFCVLCSLS